jgi:hypothetical protein
MRNSVVHAFLHLFLCPSQNCIMPLVTNFQMRLLDIQDVVSAAGSFYDYTALVYIRRRSVFSLSTSQTSK